MKTPELAFGAETLYTTRRVALPIFSRVYQRSSSGASGIETSSPSRTSKPGLWPEGESSWRGIRAHPVRSRPLKSGCSAPNAAAAPRISSRNDRYILSLARCGYGRLFGNRRAVGSRIGGAEVDAAPGVAHHRLTIAHYTGKPCDG